MSLSLMSGIRTGTSDAPKATPGRGHQHFWARAAISRRQFLQVSSAGAAGLTLGTKLLGGTGVAWADERPQAGRGVPRPIPQFIELPFAPGKRFHLQPPASGGENSTITDFSGIVAVCELQGTGTANTGERMPFDVDMRVMDGDFVDLTGRRQRGTFAFV
jgi:hypothetical protein